MRGKMKVQKESGWKKSWHFIRPTVIGVAVVLIAFFIMQGIPMVQLLDRRTDMVSVTVTQSGVSLTFTDQDRIVEAAETAGLLARRFSTEQRGEPDTCYVFTFQDGSQLTIGVNGNDILYNGKWYTGAASTPELFRNVTGGRFFAVDASGEEP